MSNKRASTAMWNWIKKLTDKTHVHAWEDSCWNRFSVAMEQKCKCGEYRHHKNFKDERDDIWHEGHNPVAEKMRQDGVTCNY